MDAKAEIMSRIARAGVRSVQAERAAVVPSARRRHDIVEQFAEYAAEYRADVRRVEEARLPKAIAEALSEKGSDLVVVPHGLPTEWVAKGILDAGFDYRALSEMHAVVTGCAIAIAETGTLVLDGGSGQGRRAITLIPDHHVCVVFEDQIVDTVPEAVARLAAAAAGGSPQTWISGPSATSDIELSRVEGVHGPRKLDIVIVSRTGSQP